MHAAAKVRQESGALNFVPQTAFRLHNTDLQRGAAWMHALPGAQGSIAGRRSPNLSRQGRVGTPKGSAMSYGGFYNQRASVQAYRTAPQPGGGGGSGGPSWSPYGGAGGGYWSGGEAHADGPSWSAHGGNWSVGEVQAAPSAGGPEIYGFQHTGGRLAGQRRWHLRGPWCPTAAPPARSLARPHAGQRVELCFPVAMRRAWTADGLPGFEGSVNAATGAGASEGEPAARYLASLCQQSLLEFQAQHSWEQQLLPGVETGAQQGGQLCAACNTMCPVCRGVFRVGPTWGTAPMIAPHACLLASAAAAVLRQLALQATPSHRDLQIRLQASTAHFALLLLPLYPARTGVPACMLLPAHSPMHRPCACLAASPCLPAVLCCALLCCRPWPS